MPGIQLIFKTQKLSHGLSNSCYSYNLLKQALLLFHSNNGHMHKEWYLPNVF